MIRSHLITSKMFLSRWKETLVQVGIAGKKYKEFLWTPGSEKEKLIGMKLSCEKSIQCILLLHWSWAYMWIVKRGRKYKKKLKLTVTKNGRCRESFIGAAWIRWLFFLFHIFFQSVVHQHKMPSPSQVPKRKTAFSTKGSVSVGLSFSSTLKPKAGGCIFDLVFAVP